MTRVVVPFRQTPVRRIGLLALACATFTAPGCDWVKLNNGSGNQTGLLIDGRTSSGQVNDRSFTGSATVLGVGDFLSGGASREIVAFTNSRPVAVRFSVPWTDSDDTVDVNFASEIAIPVKVWIVKGPFDSQRQKAIDACITTTDIWTRERMGVRFSPFEIVDATGDSEASNYFAFDCSKRDGLQRDIGKTDGRINIYFVDTVDGGTGRGQACSIGSDFVAMGSNTGDELLSHELGHDFGLEHVDAQTADFDQTNIMHSASNTRQFITEGQLFRAHLRPASALNAVYAARPGQPTRDCAHSADGDPCPLIQKRIFADGTFPPN